MKESQGAELYDPKTSSQDSTEWTHVSSGEPVLYQGKVVHLGTFLGHKFAMIKGMYFLSPLFICMLIIAVNGAYLYFFHRYVSTFTISVVCLAGIGLMLCVVLCATLDPGYVVKPKPEEVDEEASGVPEKKILCKKCNTTAEDCTTHDHFCDLCVEGYDHFCIVLGNVIGRNNICYFYSIFGFYVINIIALVIGVVNSSDTEKP